MFAVNGQRVTIFGFHRQAAKLKLLHSFTFVTKENKFSFFIDKIQKKIIIRVFFFYIYLSTNENNSILFEGMTDISLNWDSYLVFPTMKL